MSSIVRNTIKLLSGNVLSQIISILTIPIISRMFGVQEFGYFAVILSLATILSSIYTLGLHLAILMPESDSEAASLVEISAFSLMVQFLLSCIILTFAGETLILMLKLPENRWTVYFVPCLAAIQSAYLIASYYCVRKKRFGLLSNSKIAETVVERGGSVIAGSLGFTMSISLITCKLLGVILSLFMLLKKTPSSKSKYKYNFKYNSYLIKKYRNYIFYNTPSLLLINAMLQFPVVLFGVIYSPISAGIFAMANRLVGMPVQALGGALSKTITQNIAELWVKGDKKEVSDILGRFLIAFINLLLIPFIYLSVTGQQLIIILLGDKWADSGVIVEVLAFYSFSTLLVQAFGGLFDITGKQRIRLIFHIVNFTCRLGSIWLGYMLDFDFYWTVVLYGLVSTLLNVAAFFLIFNCANACKQIKIAIIKCYPTILYSIVVCLLVDLYIINEIENLILISFLLLPVYIVQVVFLKKRKVFSF